MPLLKLAIVGRPNVGKSALFNRIAKKRISIVDETEGVTRDRLYAEADLFGKHFFVIDTGGIDPHSEILFQNEVRFQAEIAIEEADVIVMCVDAYVGVTSLDEEVARILLRSKKRVCLAVNKIDSREMVSQVYLFQQLGIEKMMGISALHGFQVVELLEMALEGLEGPAEDEMKAHTKIAVIGRPNVGKSTLFNGLIGSERSIVSPIAGTTRDSIDLEVEWEGERFTLIDTAGMKRKKSEEDVIDKFAAIRTEQAIERADICILIANAEEGLTSYEKRMAKKIEDAGKGCIVLFNKWDLVKGFRMEHCLQSIRAEASFLAHCPTLFISALTKRNLSQIFPLIRTVRDFMQKRISTGQLNRFLEETVKKYHPPMLQGRRLRIYYLAQVTVGPPRFILFVNAKKLMLDTYHKYLIHAFREFYQFTGCPLLFTLRSKEKKEDLHHVVAKE